MADWKKKVHRALINELRPGEDVVAAIFLQPNSPTAVTDGAGGTLGAAVADQPAGATPEIETVADDGLAATLPDTPTVLALTTQRLLSMGHSSLTGRPKEIISALAPNDLVGLEIEDRGPTALVVMKFSDGTCRAYEAPLVNNDLHDFAARINRT